MTLVRASNANFSLELTGNEGSISSGNCDGEKNEVLATGSTFTVDNTATLGVSGATIERDFSCAGGRNYNSSPETLAFSPLTAAAAVGAPLGNSNYEITFGGAGSMFELGQQVQLGGTPAWQNPRLYVTVNPRPATGLTATAGDVQVTLDWAASPDAADITDYKIAVTGGKTATLTAANTVVQHVDSGLTNGVEYCYQIRARYHDGTNDFFSTYEPVGAPVCATPQASSASYGFNGFFSPVDTYNVVKAGQGVALKWETLEDGTEVEDDTSGHVVSSVRYTAGCDGTGTDDSPPPADDSGTSGLRWDPVAGQYVYVWKTLKSWAGTCRTFTVEYEGEQLSANFYFKK